MDEKLTIGDCSAIGLEALVNLVPYFGGSLATVIFGTRNEKRLKRLETFFQEIANQVREKGIAFSSTIPENRDALAAIIEDLADRIQRERSEEKRAYYKRFFINTLTTDDLSYDRSMTFMRILSELTSMEVKLLKNLHTRLGTASYLSDVRVAPEDDYEQVSALYRLQSFGFLKTGAKGYIMKTALPPILTNDMQLSHFGRDFVEYVLQ